MNKYEVEFVGGPIDGLVNMIDELPIYRYIRYDDNGNVSNLVYVLCGCAPCTLKSNPIWYLYKETV